MTTTDPRNFATFAIFAASANDIPTQAGFLHGCCLVCYCAVRIDRACAAGASSQRQA